jgi:hypothetical protein
VATAAATAVREQIQALSQLQEQSKSNESPLTALNALSEHVSMKVKTLETQKQTV